MQNYLERYSFLKGLILFILAQLVGTALALGLVGIAPGLKSLPGVGLEILRGIPALLIIVWFWLEMEVKKVNYRQSWGEILAKITLFDIISVVVFNLAIGILSILLILYGIKFFTSNALGDLLDSPPPSLIGLGLAATMATIIAPISEEIVFRGWLFNALKRRIPVWPAIMLSSLLFALIHPSVSSLTTFLFGVCMAIAYYKTQNLWVAIAMHALNNGVISLQSIAESLLIRQGLVNQSSDLNQTALLLGIPSLVLAILSGYHLIQQRQFFNLKIPFPIPT